jgi:hypothetical protein
MRAAPTFTSEQATDAPVGDAATVVIREDQKIKMKVRIGTSIFGQVGDIAFEVRVLVEDFLERGEGVGHGDNTR